jgi:hypothetical protein
MLPSLLKIILLLFRQFMLFLRSFRIRHNMWSPLLCCYSSFVYDLSRTLSYDFSCVLKIGFHFCYLSTRSRAMCTHLMFHCKHHFMFVVCWIMIYEQAGLSKFHHWESISMHFPCSIKFRW